MKKTIIYRLLTLALLIASFGFAEAPETKTDESNHLHQAIKICTFHFHDTGFGPSGNCSSEYLEVILDENCVGYVEMKVYVTNLVAEPELGGVYPLPPGIPDIYVRHEYKPGTWQMTGPVNQFEYIGQSTNMNNEQSPYYAAELLLPMTQSYVEQCDNGGSTYVFDMGVELVMLIEEELGLNSEYELYPIHDYSGLGGIFYCQCFSETCNDCDPAPVNCDPNANQDPTYNVGVCIECGDCEESGGGGGFIDGSNPIFTDVEQNLRNASFELTPNPFRDEVILSATVEIPGDLSIRIFDAQGKLMEQVDREAEDQFLQTIATDHLPNGVYYFQIRAASEVQTLKMVKL